MLLALGLDSIRDLANDDRFKTHIKCGRVEKGKISLQGKVEYIREVNIRAGYLISDSTKQPRPNDWKNPKRLEWLIENPVNDVERDWAYEKVDLLMDNLDRQAEEDVIPGSNIRATDKYKMRLYKAYF